MNTLIIRGLLGNLDSCKLWGLLLAGDAGVVGLGSHRSEVSLEVNG